jgi:protein-L-isoaspartate O-methyltransferase
MHSIPDSRLFTSRPVGLLTAVRPDYYEWWPTFSDIQLWQRLKIYDPSVATLAVPRNVGRCAELKMLSAQRMRTTFVRDHLSSGDIIASIVKAAGFSQAVQDGFHAVDRGAFLLQEFRSFAALNTSLPVTRSTWLSAFGIVALINENIISRSPSVVVEIGAGTGYHAATLAVSCPNAQIITYEANLHAARLAENCLGNLTGRVKLVASAFSETMWPDEPCVLFSTAKISLDRYHLFKQLMHDGQVIILPRPLLSAEYQRFSGDTGFSRIFPEYKTSTPFLALTAVSKQEENIHEEVICYDVNFVEFHEGEFSENDCMSEFYSELNRKLNWC